VDPRPHDRRRAGPIGNLLVLSGESRVESQKLGRNINLALDSQHLALDSLMHIFLYEWITGGGLVEEPSPLPETLLIEGEAMLTALATDLAAIPNAQVTVLRDARLEPLSIRGCGVVDVHSRENHLQEFSGLAAEADHTIVIAPEFDGILSATLQLARDVSANLIAPTSQFVAITSNKHLTAQRLAAAGVPVPEAILLDADVERLPIEFTYPGVLKPLDGAGSQHTFLVTSRFDEPPPYPWPRRLERYVPGIAASVAFLCGSEQRVPLAACRQHLADNGRFGYLGGSLLWETDLAQRATQLAARALDAIPGSLGYVGVDLVLGEAGDGSQDTVIEINPRLTTSYVGLRAMTHDNLAAGMLEIAAGREFMPNLRLDPLEFSANGSVRRPLG
jgi:predicted ATP-grasp superfamily ATP-dependent carboligase